MGREGRAQEEGGDPLGQMLVEVAEFSLILVFFKEKAGQAVFVSWAWEEGLRQVSPEPLGPCMAPCCAVSCNQCLY